MIVSENVFVAVVDHNIGGRGGGYISFFIRVRTNEGLKSVQSNWKAKHIVRVNSFSDINDKNNLEGLIL